LKIKQEEATFRNNIFNLLKATWTEDWTSTNSSGGAIGSSNNSFNFLIKRCYFNNCTAGNGKNVYIYVPNTNYGQLTPLAFNYAFTTNKGKSRVFFNGASNGRNQTD